MWGCPVIRLELVRPDGKCVLITFPTATGFFTDETLLYVQCDEAEGGVLGTYGKCHVFRCDVMDEQVPMVRH